MKLEFAQEGDFHTIKAIGDLDAVSAIELDNALEEAFNAGQKFILIDCTALDYIASAGIGVFTSRIDECEQKGVRLVLFGMSEKVMNVFKILGLHVIIPIVNTKEEAKRAAHDAQL